MGILRLVVLIDPEKATFSMVIIIYQGWRGRGRIPFIGLPFFAVNRHTWAPSG
jgi:hypothetical protein